MSLIKLITLQLNTKNSFTEDSSHPPPRCPRGRPSLRGLGARRSLSLRAHKTIPRDGGEEDWSSSPSSRCCVSSSVREGAHPSTLPRPRHRGTAYPCASIQGELNDTWRRELDCSFGM